MVILFALLQGNKLVEIRIIQIVGCNIILVKGGPLGRYINDPIFVSELVCRILDMNFELEFGND